MKFLIVLILFPVMVFAQYAEKYDNCSKWQRTSDGGFSCVLHFAVDIPGVEMQASFHSIEYRLSQLENHEPDFKVIKFKEVYNCRNWIMRNGFYKCGSAPHNENLIDTNEVQLLLESINKRIQTLENEPGPAPELRTESITVCLPWASKGGSFICRTPPTETAVITYPSLYMAIIDFSHRLFAIENP